MPPHAPPRPRTDAAERFSLRAQPWWTDADQAELDTLTDELVRLTHGRAWDEHLTAALEVVLAFREQRARLSRAVWLRDQQQVADTETLVAHYVAEARERWWPEPVLVAA